MTFPSTSRGARVEMKIDGAWVDVTAKDPATGKGDILSSDDIVITRGRSDGDATGAPSSCAFTVNNRLGKYSPRNPMSPYYNKIGRNTPVRVVIRKLPAPVFDAASNAPEGTGNFSWTHTPVGKPTGIVIWLQQSGSNIFTTGITVTYGGVSVPYHGSGATNSNGQYYRFFLGSGIPAGPQTISITAPGGLTRRPVAITVTGGTDIEINNVPATTTGTTANPSKSIGTSEETLVLGLLHSGQDDISGVAPGTGYTDVLEHDFGTDVMSVIRRTSAAAAGNVTVSWTATADNWTINDVALAAVSYRFTGEIASFPAELDDTTNNQAWVPMRLQASGIGRRLGQGDQPLNSSLRSYYETFPLLDYWPLDDGAGSTTGANADGTDDPFRISAAVPTTAAAFGGDLGQFLGTGLSLGDTGAGSVFGSIGSTDSTALSQDFVFKATGLGILYVTLELYGPIEWKLKFNHNGTDNDIQLDRIDSVSLTTIGNTAPLTALVDGRPHHVRLALAESGANVNATVYLDGVSVISGTQLSDSLPGARTTLSEFVDLGSGSTIVLGHVAIWDASFPAPPIATAAQAAAGWTGEPAGRRIERLCAEEGVPFVSRGNLDNTTPMGPQYSDYFANQLTECEATDMGLSFEPRYQLATGYRTRTDLYTQAPVVTLSPNQLAPPLRPTDDDQLTHNDVFGQRREGSSWRATLTAGPLSVQDPPNGVGRYKHETQFNCQTDALLEGLAYWTLAQGTIDEARFPQIMVDLADADIVAAGIGDAIMAIDIGDRLAATGLEGLNIYRDLSLLILGGEERLNEFTHKITFNARPESPYAVAKYGTGVGSGPDRYDTAGSELVSGITSTATSLSVQPSAGATALWTTTAGEFPFEIEVGGERMTVTNITSSTAPQTFTVTRSVNGVMKTHAAGAKVRLWRTPRYGL